MKKCEVCGTIKTHIHKITGYEDWYGGKTGNTYCRNCWRLKIKPNKSKQIKCACGCGETIPSINTRGVKATFKHNHHAKYENHYKWNGGRYLNSQGYILVKARNHPKAKKSRSYMIREHILVMEKHLGRYLTDDEIVHHINENRQDNRIENLQLMSKREHDRYHMIKRNLLTS